MACTILGVSGLWRTALLLAITLAGSRPSKAQAPLCLITGDMDVSATSQQDIKDTEQSTEAGALYKELVKRAGYPKTCAAKLDGNNITLSYAFANDSRLEARVEPSIEYSEQKAHIMALGKLEAMAILKRTASGYLGGDDCGIDWSRPLQQSGRDGSGTRSTVFSGRTCNCRARIIFRKSTVVAIVMSSAC